MLAILRLPNVTRSAMFLYSSDRTIDFGARFVQTLKSIHNLQVWYWTYLLIGVDQVLWFGKSISKRVVLNSFTCCQIQIMVPLEMTRYIC